MSFLHHLCTTLILSCLLLGQVQALSGDSGINFTIREVGVPIQVDDTDIHAGHYILTLEDGSFMEVQVPPFEYRTFWEWCTGATHKQPDDRFFFEIEKWPLPSYIQLYEYTYDDASARRIFGDRAPHICSRYQLLMYNAHTNQFLFCRTLTPMDMMIIVEEERIALEWAAREEERRAHTYNWNVDTTTYHAPAYNPPAVTYESNASIDYNAGNYSNNSDYSYNGNGGNG